MKTRHPEPQLPPVGTHLEEMQWRHATATSWEATYLNKRLTIEKLAEKAWRGTLDYANSKRGAHPISSTTTDTRRSAAVWCCETIGIRRYHSFRLHKTTAR